MNDTRRPIVPSHYTVAKSITVINININIIYININSNYYAISLKITFN